ncbi:MAG: hypothetical protein CUN49_04635 [Candidatus Thermofonsia Clade 1 bacterium]|jgi:hypothetical protein|uniref:Uncharacterized protein n=1 Tax=Candidatus Thermofonsia Clade 1 bacterium TaxID=2364210 RepID=A0A2M8PGC1_9CHLR|nr:MAG: hypothetical protein CUN49_04635 [Candidatus Thermofonsia Clade 1 bacterium]RMF52754.1 MAG: hypothetical protein D6749_04070 [Chloroflexota bacterium]
MFLKRIWVEQASAEGFNPYQDSADVIVETHDGQTWLAHFVTIPFLQRQMHVSREVAEGEAQLLPVSFITLETPHVLVENLLIETIEDTIENLITLGTFESVFVPYFTPDLLPEDDAVLSQ